MRWMDECVSCVCVCFYMSSDSQAPYIETARVHGWVQEMTTIMPNVPFASVSLMVMDMVCNREEMWPHCESALQVFKHQPVCSPP